MEEPKLDSNNPTPGTYDTSQPDDKTEPAANNTAGASASKLKDGTGTETLVKELVDSNAPDDCCSCLRRIIRSRRRISAATLATICEAVDTKAGFHVYYDMHGDATGLSRILNNAGDWNKQSPESKTDWLTFVNIAVEKNDKKGLECALKHAPDGLGIVDVAVYLLRAKMSCVVRCSEKSVQLESKFVRDALTVISRQAGMETAWQEILAGVADGCCAARDRGMPEEDIVIRTRDLMAVFDSSGESFIDAYLSVPVASPEHLELAANIGRELDINEDVLQNALLRRFVDDLHQCRVDEDDARLRSMAYVLESLENARKLDEREASVEDLTYLANAFVNSPEFESKCWTTEDAPGLIQMILSHTTRRKDILSNLYENIKTVQDLKRLERICQEIGQPLSHFSKVLSGVADKLDIDEYESLELAVSVYLAGSAEDLTDSAQEVFRKALSSEQGFDRDTIADMLSRMERPIAPAIVAQFSARTLDVYFDLLTSGRRRRERAEALELLLSADRSADRFVWCVQNAEGLDVEHFGGLGDAFIVLGSSLAQLEPERTVQLQTALAEMPAFVEYVRNRQEDYIFRVCSGDAVGQFLQGIFDMLNQATRLQIVASAIDIAREMGNPLPVIEWAAGEISKMDVDNAVIEMLNADDGDLADAALLASFDQLRQGLIDKPRLVHNVVSIMEGLDNAEIRGKWLLEFAQVLNGQIEGLYELYELHVIHSSY